MQKQRMLDSINLLVKRARNPNGLKHPNRERAILNTILDAKERHKEASNKLQKARIRLQQAKVKANEIQINGLTQMDREHRDLVL